MADLLIDQDSRHHADHLAAGGQGCVSRGPHQAHAAAAVNEGQAGLGDQGPCRDRFFEERGVVPGGRSAVDADAFHEAESRLSMCP